MQQSDTTLILKVNFYANLTHLDFVIPLTAVSPPGIEALVLNHNSIFVTSRWSESIMIAKFQSLFIVHS